MADILAKQIKNKLLTLWTAEKSADLYGILNWGAGFFSVNKDGHVVINSKKYGQEGVSILEVIEGMKERGLDLPVLLRVTNLLESQISFIHESFRSAIKDFNYKGQYQGVYPIKVNQQQQVIEEIIKVGEAYNHGLEVGSKAELIAALGMIKKPGACLICNGYKDQEFIDLGLYATKLGFQCFFVLEMANELTLILERSEIIGVKPKLGIRIKLTSKAGGHWAESSGVRSLFGLTTSEMIRMLDLLREKDMMDCLQLLHYHIGSQIPNIRDIRQSLMEACRIYTELVQEGAQMGYLDLGGGLAVDYDGSKTNFPASCNYTLDEYCADIIEIIMSNLDDKKIPHPTIITESGRATVAYCSILLFNVLDVRYFEAPPMPEKLPGDLPEMVNKLIETYKYLNLKNVQECYNDALYYNGEIQQLFRMGQISLRQKSLGENIFMNIIHQINSKLKKLKRIPPELKDLDTALTDIYYCNFSIFQSLPDAWAIQQLFPIMPIHKLDKVPDRKTILADITCDSDGKIDHFIDLHDIRHYLPLHSIKHGEEYYLGVFLVGAYQETLGDLHNLMGDPNVVTIRINNDGEYDFVKEHEGDTVADVLSYVEYDPKKLVERFRMTAERAVKEGRIAVKERRNIMQAYEDGMQGYTYFEK